jgi:hypothetical protein
MRRAGRKDVVQAEIVDALEDIGITVVITNNPAEPDLLTHSRGHWLPIEVKSPGGKLTPKQAQLYQQAPFPIVSTVEEALALFGVRVSPSPVRLHP